MKSTEDVLAILRAAKPDLVRRFGLRGMALFGSYARGEQLDSSDVDVLVDVDPSIGLRFVELAEVLEQLLGIPADVVSIRSLSPRTRQHIEHEALHVA